MTAGGRTPEELETLLEDALLMRDAEALTPLFEDAGVLVAGRRPQLLRGPREIARAARLLWDQPRGYLAGPRRELLAEPLPCSTLIGVKELASPDLLVEIDAIAVIPDQCL